MRKCFLNLLLVLAPFLSEAAKRSITCQPISPPNSGHRYLLVVSPSRDRLVVQDAYAGQVTNLVTLKCDSSGDAGSGHPDQLVTYSCYERQNQFSGFNVTMKLGGVAGYHDAILSMGSHSKSKVLAKMKCRRDD